MEGSSLTSEHEDIEAVKKCLIAISHIESEEKETLADPSKDSMLTRLESGVSLGRKCLPSRVHKGHLVSIVTQSKFPQEQAQAHLLDAQFLVQMSVIAAEQRSFAFILPFVNTELCIARNSSRRATALTNLPDGVRT